MKSSREIARIKRVEGGLFIEPQDADNCPLLVQLYHGDASEIGQVIIDMTLDELVENVKQVAPKEGLSLVVCGNVKTEPVLSMKARRVKPQEPMHLIFGDLRGDGAKWGVADFYDENEAALRAAIKGRMPFDTGFYGVKKEIQSARVWRSARNGPIRITVSCEMDDPIDLVDTALWRAFGGNATCVCGSDALAKLGFSDDEADKSMVFLADGFQPQTTESDEATLHWKTGFDGVCKALDLLADGCDSTLKQTYEELVEYCKEYITGQKRRLGASCLNCKFFQPAIAESRQYPAEVADCGHKKYCALLSANRHFPFAKGCKFWEVKQ